MADMFIQVLIDCARRLRHGHGYVKLFSQRFRVFPTSRTNSASVAARFLLKPGRKYEDAVEAFQPYNETKEVNEEARKAGANLIEEGASTANRKTYIYVNNRLEGNALATIEAMLAHED